MQVFVILDKVALVIVGTDNVLFFALLNLDILAKCFFRNMPGRFDRVAYGIITKTNVCQALFRIHFKAKNHGRSAGLIVKTYWLSNK